MATDQTPISVKQRHLAPQRALLSGWKEIANYLGKGIRTVQRYELELELPIHRPAGKFHGSVQTTKTELAEWVGASPIREAGGLNDPKPMTSVLKELRLNLAQMSQLRQETRKLQSGLRESRELLHINLHVIRNEATQTTPIQASPLLSSSEHQSLSNVLTFHATKKKE